MKPQTLVDALLASAQRFPDKPALMHRPDDAFVPISYGELVARAQSVAAALERHGVGRGDRVAIISDNRPEWAFVDWGVQWAGVLLVPIYTSLSAPQIAYILRDSGAKIVFCEGAALHRKCAPLVGDLPEHPLLVTFEPVADALDFASFLSPADTPTLPSTSEEGEGKGIGGDSASPSLHGRGLGGGFGAGCEPEAVGGDDVCTIIYTSGTTGDPKGVMLTHRNILSDIEACLEVLDFNHHDVLLSLLPLSHVFERMAGHYVPMYVGATIAYVKSLRTVAEDLTTVKPTAMMWVPRFLEQLKEKATAEASTGAKGRVFGWALRLGSRRFELLREGRNPSLGLRLELALADALVGRKVRNRMGGRLRIPVAGGAALQAETAEFYWGFGVPVMQGYGLTETSPVIAVNSPKNNRLGTVGKPLPGFELKIAEDGEILTRGPHVMKGYFNLPEATAEAIDSDGWFHTGDIGELDEDGYLRITDRKKDLLVLANGKNVAPQPVENLLRNSPLIEEAVVLGDGQNVVTALIVPNVDALRERLGKPDLSREDAVSCAEAHAAVKRELDELCANLAEFERVKRFTLLSTPFTVQGGELTPTLKVRRKVVREKYADSIAAMGR